MPIRTQKLAVVQVLRAIAVLLVVYVHTAHPTVGPYGPSRQSAFFYLTSWGCIGVDLFFVISGFIMTRIIHAYEGNNGWKLFAFKRALRIIPLYWTLSLVVGLLILRTYPVRAVTLWKTISFFPLAETEFVPPIIPAGWTLSYELYFYFLIALVLRLHFRNPRAVIVVLLTVLGTVGYFVDSTALLPRFMSSPLLLEFALGVGCGMLYDNVQPTTRWHRAGIYAGLVTGLLFVLAPIFLDYGDLLKADHVMASNHLAFWRSVVWGIPCALLLLGCVLLERVYAFTSPPVLVFMGDVSYSTYLVHGPIIIFGNKFIQHLHLNADLNIIIQVLVCILGSMVLYQLGERPLTNRLNQYFFPKKPKLAPLETAS